MGYSSFYLLIYHLEYITRSVVGKIPLQHSSETNIHVIDTTHTCSLLEHYAFNISNREAENWADMAVTTLEVFVNIGHSTLAEPVCTEQGYSDIGHHMYKLRI